MKTHIASHRGMVGGAKAASMFYLFHHMLKCGETTFRMFLRTVFTVHNDFPGTDPQTDPQRFSDFISNTFNLSKMTSRDCLVGHYNINRIRLEQRWPELEATPHKKFTILREPLEAARSGLCYKIKRAFLSDSMSKLEEYERLLKRANYFTRVFGITNEAELPALFNRYRFIARIDHVLRLIGCETGRKGQQPPRLNTTIADNSEFPQDLVEEFHQRSQLDYKLYDIARLRFGRLAAIVLDQKSSTIAS